MEILIDVLAAAHTASVAMYDLAKNLSIQPLTEEDQFSSRFNVPSECVGYSLDSWSPYAYQIRIGQLLLLVSEATYDKKTNSPMFEAIIRLAAKI